MKKTIFAVASIVFLVGCSDSNSVELHKNSGEVKSSLIAGSYSKEELKKEAEEVEALKKKLEAQELAKSTTCEFNELEHDFGDVDPQTEVSYTFKVKNTGDKPLIIESAKASCGCTIPKKPEEPIAPGEEGDMEVTFKSKPSQKGEIVKTVTVTANIPGGTTQVKIKANVKA